MCEACVLGLTGVLSRYSTKKNISYNMKSAMYVNKMRQLNTVIASTEMHKKSNFNHHKHANLWKRVVNLTSECYNTRNAWYNGKKWKKPCIKTYWWTLEKKKKSTCMHASKCTWQTTIQVNKTRWTLESRCTDCNKINCNKLVDKASTGTMKVAWEKLQSK
jgi:hypothetical protein